MKKTRKMSTLLVLVMVLMAACQCFPGALADGAASYTIWQRGTDNGGYYQTYDQNPVVSYIQEKFGVKWVFQTPAQGNETESFNTMIGTGDYTDVISTSYATSEIATMYADGVIIDIAPYLECCMPNLSAILAKYPEYKAMLFDDDGHLLTLPIFEPTEMGGNGLMWGGLLYRRDILDTMTGGNIAFPSGVGTHRPPPRM